jgi:predicted ATP-grasp superfamily ATP-dependent carboligase
MKRFFNQYALWVIPALMIFFFVRNIVYTKTQHMDAWMGGGMRMFTSVDKMLYRVSGFKTVIDSNEYFVNLRHFEKLKKVDAGIRVKPTQELMRDAVRILESKSWCLDTTTRKVILCDDSFVGTPINDFKVQQILVYRTAFDPVDKKVSLVKITEYTPSNER